MYTVLKVDLLQENTLCVHCIESRFVTGAENTLFAGVCALFSPQILQAGAVNGLK